ncbi:MAG TPA: YlxR family protein, partial [Chloroflexota bacterium]|nr:YlxR family protein [Chloroflexota bacterium]
MKHVPTRSCVACRDAKPKRELVRVVRTGPDMVEVDPTGRKNGRGAYLCPAQDCWRLAQNKKALNHALEVAVTPDIW